MAGWASSLVLLGAAACFLVPERFAVNAPVAHLLLGKGVEAPTEETFGGRIRAADGLSVSLYADGLRNARFLRFTPSGHLLVSQPRSGRVVLLLADADGNGRPDGRRVLLSDLNRPHGLDLHDGWLYVGETNAVGRVRFDDASGTTQGRFERVVRGIPGGGNHWTRTVRIGPDGWLYVSIGSTCNVCEEEDPRRASLVRYRPDGSGEEIYATGLRNTVGFDWHPETGDLYGTDNGRDLLGDDYPPCELNRIVRGGFYGWPYANGDNDPDPDLGAGREDRIAKALPPAHAFRAHNAPLGITFVRGREAPPAYRGAALVALHGSWNRTRKDGYKVVSLHWTAGGHIEERDFLVGFLEDEDVIGRPVDVAEGPDGAFYVSDDYAGAIYRVTAGTGPRGLAGGTAPAAEVEQRTAATRDDPGALARGRALYEQHTCARCHEAEQAEPGVVPVALEGLSDRYSRGSLQDFLAAPTPPMPLANLDEAERRDLAAFLLAER
ncbi:MAG: PQQ-dependent sugar dehydrogenase [Myxococcota bacterium]|nr:PQQ-dependent sugar dehydrogenase [Myxococcota bacterium]